MISYGLTWSTRSFSEGEEQTVSPSPLPVFRPDFFFFSCTGCAWSCASLPHPGDGELANQVCSGLSLAVGQTVLLTSSKLVTARYWMTHPLSVLSVRWYPPAVWATGSEFLKDVISCPVPASFRFKQMRLWTGDYGDAVICMCVFSVSKLIQ